MVDLARLPAGLPIQVIVGEADLITLPAFNQEIAAAGPASSIHVITGAGHALYFEKPAAVQPTTGRLHRGACGSMADGTVARRRTF
jgi:pimeloyl-ACP methyl ester carboxylesterase